MATPYACFNAKIVFRSETEARKWGKRIGGWQWQILERPEDQAYLLAVATPEGWRVLRTTGRLGQPHPMPPGFQILSPASQPAPPITASAAMAD